MAKNATIGSLRVTLGADTAQFEAGMRRSQKRLGSLGKTMKRVGAAMAVAFSAAAFAASRALMGFSAEADKLAKMSRSIGIPVEELSRLKHAAELSGVGIDAFGKSIKRLSANMGEVAAGMGGTAGRAFDQLGISVKNADGVMKSSTQVMSEIADKFTAMEDGAQKTSLAIAIGGQKFADFIPLLNTGAAGIKQLTDEADELGITLSQRTAAAAEAFNDSITRMKAGMGGVITRVGNQMLPVLANLGEMLVDASKDSALMESAAEAMSITLKSLVSVVIVTGSAFKTLAKIVHTSLLAIGSAAAGDFAGARSAILNGMGDVADTAKGTFEILERIWSTAAEQQAVAAAKIRAQNKVIFSEAEQNAKRTSGVITKTIVETADAGESLAGTMQSVSERMGSGLADVATGARDLRDVLQGISEELASEAIRNLLPNLLKSGFGGLSGQMNISPAANLNAGLGGFFSAIPGLLGFAKGGSFEVGGGGGIDSQLVAFNATPGERVTVTNPGQDGGGGGLTYAPTINAGMTPVDRAWVASTLERGMRQAVQMAKAETRAMITTDPGFRRPA